MWQDEELLQQLDVNFMIPTAAKITAEFNINATATPLEMGTYTRAMGYKPYGSWLESPPQDHYFFIKYIEPLDDMPLTLMNSKASLMDEYFSLKDCFKFRRPRAGILYTQFPSALVPVYIEDYKTSKRPRHYIVGKDMEFKYWNSSVLDRYGEQYSGISHTSDFNDAELGYSIQDTAPYIVYKTLQFANKIVVKMQTYNGERIDDVDPIADMWRIPNKWDIEYLDEQLRWRPVKSFTPDDVIPTDGHIELMYGVTAPLGYEDTFRLYGSIEYLDELNKIPMEQRHIGMAYKYHEVSLYIWDGTTWVAQSIKYGWIHTGEDVFEYTIEDIVNPNSKEFIKLRGLRLVIYSMSMPGIPFELIELSPRLQVNIRSYVDSFELTKSLGVNADSLPFGELSNDLGSMELLNYDGAFTSQNTSWWDSNS